MPPVRQHKARLVRILLEDPDLAHRLDSDDAEAAVRQTVGVLDHIAPGPWAPAGLADGKCLFGGLVLDGLLVREQTVGGAVSSELLGAGDLVLPHDVDDVVPFVHSRPAWTALEHTRIAWLDGPFVAAVRRWPELSAALLERSHRRMERIGVLQSIGQLTRIDDRVLMLLWHLAERWGRVRSDGILLPLRLPHKVIAQLVGARRPSVTTAIGALERRGLLERRVDGAWLLAGPAPTALETLVPRESPWRDLRTGEPAVSRVTVVDESPRPSPDLEPPTKRAADAVARARALKDTSAELVARARARALPRR